jgi:hypothetical protein
MKMAATVNEEPEKAKRKGRTFVRVPLIVIWHVITPRVIVLFMIRVHLVAVVDVVRVHGSTDDGSDLSLCRGQDPGQDG